MVGHDPHPEGSKAADDLKGILLDAAGRYSYPCVVWDFSKRRELELESMRCVESTIREQLTSGDPDAVKHGLADVVYWGFRSQGYYKRRFSDFLTRVSAVHVEMASRLLPEVKGVALRKLKALGLPQFSNMTFLSKLRMFLDPERYVALDKHLANLALARTATMFRDLRTYKKAGIPCNERNIPVYARWCGVCRRWGQEIGLHAVDVERGVYTLAKEGPLDLAASIVAKMERS